MTTEISPTDARPSATLAGTLLRRERRSWAMNKHHLSKMAAVSYQRVVRLEGGDPGSWSAFGAICRICAQLEIDPMDLALALDERCNVAISEESA